MRLLIHPHRASAVRVSQSLLAQLEASGSWPLLMDACLGDNDESAVLRLGERLPLPDGLPEAASGLLAVARSSATLPASALHMSGVPCLLAALHAHLGVRYAHAHQSELACKHHLAVVQLYAGATTYELRAIGTADDSGLCVDSSYASCSWRLAHSLLVNELILRDRQPNIDQRASLVTTQLETMHMRMRMRAMACALMYAHPSSLDGICTTHSGCSLLLRLHLTHRALGVQVERCAAATEGRCHRYWLARCLCSRKRPWRAAPYCVRPLTRLQSVAVSRHAS